MRKIREEFRIVGTLIGCLPRAPRQNVHLGLPLQLMKEEVTLLLEKGFNLLIPCYHFVSSSTSIKSLYN